MGLEKQAVLAVDAKSVIGECCFQDPRDNCLYWTDIEGCTIHRRAPSGQVDSFVVPGRAGFIYPLRSEGFVLGFSKQVCLANQSLQKFQRVVDVETDLPATRINDAAVDPFGGIVFGTYNETPAPDKRPICSVYRLDLSGGLRKLLDGVAISNGIEFSPDGETMYFSDTAEGAIRRFRLGSDDFADLNEIDPLASADGAPGLPDGGCVDRQGNYWSARVWGHCAVRFSPEGKVNGVVKVPTKGPTCVALGGEELDELYVTSLRTNHSDTELEQNPAAGGVFSAKVDIAGIPQRLCALAH